MLALKEECPMTEIYESALQFFNEQMGTSYTVTNPELILITKKTGVEIKNAVRA